jgi:hypothetical protein
MSKQDDTKDEHTFVESPTEDHDGFVQSNHYAAGIKGLLKNPRM